MSFLERKVLENRLHFIRDFAKKEWWYTGIAFDIDDEDNPGKKRKAFIGLSICRSIYLDTCAVIWFDGKNVYPKKNSDSKNYKAGYYKKKNVEKTDGNMLVQKSKNLQFEYSAIDGDGEKNGWKLKCHLDALKKYNSSEFDVELTLKKKNPPFTKYDDNFDYIYELFCSFFDVEEGFIKMNGKEYKLSASDNAMVYQDHCNGKVPSKTKWHWAAVWNENVMFDTLMNYGVYPQLYTQIYIKDKKSEWTRLNQNVSFECDDNENRFEKQWKITSTDLDLNMQLLGMGLEKESIPPFVNLFHYQGFAKIWGKVKIDEKWVETGDMYGVFEEHHGKW